MFSAAAGEEEKLLLFPNHEAGWLTMVRMLCGVPALLCSVMHLSWVWDACSRAQCFHVS